MKNKELFKILTKQGKIITFAESITGGALASNLVSIAGASNVIKESYIVYNEVSKQSILEVSPDFIKRYGLVSREVSEAMNEGLKKITKADVYVSITGNAGPTYQSGHVEKAAYVAIECVHTKQVFKIDLKSKSRQKNIRKAVAQTYKHIIEVLNNK